jgi:hypothetical protein
MSGIHVVHDLLDSQVVDRRGEKMGRVDGIVLEQRAGEPPRVAYLLVGGVVLAERVGRHTTKLARGLRRLWGGGEPTPTRLSMGVVRRIGTEIDVDIEGQDMPALGWERWLREHVICRIPGA